MNIGVYIPVKNEEFFIKPCVEQVIQIFPEAEVLDLGSKDNTLEILKHLDVKVSRYGNITGREFIELKNELSSKHDWVFWVDGDEIYTKENLEKIFVKIKSGKYFSYRVGWKFINVIDRRLVKSEIVVNGGKLYSPKVFKNRRSWPRQVLCQYAYLDKNLKEPKEESTIWCWHCRLLKRTSKFEEKAKKKRRLSLEGRIRNGSLNWNWSDLDRSDVKWLPEESYVEFV